MTTQMRINWPHATTRALIHLLEDNLAALQSNTWYSRIYSRLLDNLDAGLPHGEGPYNIKQLWLKMNNLGERYP
ncbi:hypothetical protein MRX96_030141 [Rhipicephalus microplus]